MHVKKNLQNLPTQKRLIYYWVSVILMIDIFAALPHLVNYARTGMCRNYMYINSSMHACSALEFVKNGWAWVSFADLLVFLPAAFIMTLASDVLSTMLAKKE